MPANLPPQFFELQKKLKENLPLREKIEILKEMLAVCPKHKGTEKVQRELKRKIAKFKKELKIEKKQKKREDFYTIKKEGGGQVVICGPPNSGKTSLVNALSQTDFKVREYPFTTTIPKTAMMDFEDIKIQLIDTPPLTKEFSPGWLKNILQNSDLILVLFEPREKLRKNTKEIEEIFQNWNLKEKRILFLVNKIDLLTEKEKENVLKEGKIYLGISVSQKTNLEKLKEEIFKNLEIVRVYSKKPGREPDFSHPFILKKGTTLFELIEQIHKDFLKSFKFAKLYQKEIKNPLLVGKEYILKDKDIIEIH